MNSDTDKLIQAAEAAGFRVVRFNDAAAYACDDEGKDITPQLAAFASAHIASLCGDVEPVARMSWDHRLSIMKADNNGPFVCWTDHASTVAALKAERDAALARVAELEKDAARYRWLRNRIDPREISECFGFRGHNVDEKISLRTDSSIDAALTKGQLAPQPQQEQSK